MTVRRTTVALCALMGAMISAGAADARTQDQAQHPRQSAKASGAAHAKRAAAEPRQSASRHAGKAHAGNSRASHRTRSYAVAASGGLSCVPYARAVSGLQVSGNGGQWWSNAAGLSDRGQQPEPGSVMVFRASGGMGRGHVAVVRHVVGAREVLIDHANWAGPGIRRGSVMQNVSVVDVSDRNDWTAVKVQVGHDRTSFGRTYPTYGFIYNRPDASANAAYAGRTLRRSTRVEQVAEYPGGRATPVVFNPASADLPADRSR